MKTNVRLLTLGVTVAVALGAATLATGDADAKPKRPADNGVRCSVTGATVDPPSENDFEFYAPGEWVTVVGPDGRLHMLECQPDGTWKVISLVRPRQVPAGPRPSITQR